MNDLPQENLRSEHYKIEEPSLRYFGGYVAKKFLECNKCESVLTKY